MQSLLINKVNISARVDTSLQQDEHASASGSQQMPGSSADFYGRRFNTHQVEGANLSLPDSERPIIQQDNIEYSASAAGLIKNARRRTRRALQPRQREALHAKFKECQSIVGTARQELAQELTLPELTIKTWFKNRRALQKQKTVLAGLSLPDSERPIIQQDNIEYSASAAGLIKNARRKTRIVLQPWQREALRTKFKSDQYIMGAARRQLAQNLNLTENTVAVWFNNHRALQKKQAKQAGEHSQQPTLSYPQQNQKETADSTTPNLSSSANKGMPLVSPIPTGLPNANNLYGLPSGHLQSPAMWPLPMFLSPPFLGGHSSMNHLWQTDQYQQPYYNPPNNYNNWGANLNLYSGNRVNTGLDVVNTATQKISSLPTAVFPDVSNAANNIEATSSTFSEFSSDFVNESPQASTIPSTHSTSLQHQNLLHRVLPNEPYDDQVAEKPATIVRSTS